MTDWKGNEIQVGDVIFGVRTTPMFGEVRMMMFDFSGKNEPKQIGETYHPSKHCWYEGEKYLITDKGNELSFTLNDQDNENIGTISIHILDEMRIMFFGNWPTICIVGKSDSEEEYYLKYFEDDNNK